MAAKKKVFVVELRRTCVETTTLTVEAKNTAEAAELALEKLENAEIGELENWDLVDDDTIVQDVYEET